MKFIDREQELKLLNECKELSKKKLYTVMLSGLRRIGKTRLIQEFMRKEGLYFFVTKNKSSLSLLKEYEGILKKEGILTPLETTPIWDDFFKVLFERYKGIIVFDEFQNFNETDNSVFGILQKFIDTNENNEGILIVFSGSLIGLLKKIFGNYKEPLYARIKRELKLGPLPFKAALEITNNLKISFEDSIKLYCIFGGFPKYYVAIEDENMQGKGFNEIFNQLFIKQGAVLEDEVMKILSIEFGKRKGVYYDILTAIANGENTTSKIASYLQKKETQLTRYLNELQNFFEIINVEKPLIGKKSIYIIKNPIMNLWFALFYKNNSSYKIRDPDFISKIKNNLNSYIGKRFELICINAVKNSFNYETAGKQWGKFKGEKGKNTYEIDIVGINEETEEILFAECKWQDNVDAVKVLEELKEKAKHVDWNNSSRKENYAVFAKSFSKKVKGIHLYDLKDIEKAMRK